MRTWIILALCWYLQDVAQLVMTQTFLAPEIFILAVIRYGTDESELDPLKWIAAALAGGLLMDFRWTGIPGLCGALYTLALLAARCLWFQIPRANRHMPPYVFINAVICAVLSSVRLFLWNADVLSGRILTVLGVQWLFSAVLLIIFGLRKVFSYED